MTTNLPPPSFCYILTAQSGEIDVQVDEEEPVSNLYQPPAVRGLKDILQVICFTSQVTNALYHWISGIIFVSFPGFVLFFQIHGCNERCSFWAQVLYLRLQVMFFTQDKINMMFV